MHASWISWARPAQLDRPEAVTKHKLVIPTKGIMILVFWEKSFKSKRQIRVVASQDLFLHLAKEFLLLPEYVVTKLSLLNRDVSSWVTTTWEPQEYDTTRCNSSSKNLPHWNMQGYDVQHGSVKKSRVAGFGSRDFFCHSQVLF